MNSLILHKKHPLTCPRAHRKKMAPLDRVALGCWGVGLVLFTLPLFLYVGGVRWNTSASVPLGFYWRSQSDIRPGVLVHFCLVEGVAEFGYQRGYIGHGLCPGLYEELLKPVAAVEGDMVEISLSGVSVNGVPMTNTPVFETDSHGRPSLLLLPFGSHVVPIDSVFVLSTTNARSWDSRYFGFIPIDLIRGTAHPLWVWR